MPGSRIFKSTYRAAMVLLVSSCSFLFASFPNFSPPRADYSPGKNWNKSSGRSRLYRLGVSQDQKAKVSGDERPQLRAS